MTLAVDEYGNVLRAVAIGYGRRYSFDDPSLDPVSSLRCAPGSRRRC